MKQIKRSNIILALVSIAILIKAVQNKNLMMGLVAFLLIVLFISRVLLFKKVIKMDTLDDMYENTDFIHLYLKEYKEMHEVYKQGNCEVLYEENDGILLYDHTSKKYYASAKSIEGAKDIVRLLPQDYGEFVVYDEVFEVIEAAEIPKIRKEKEDNLHYYSK